MSNRPHRRGKVKPRRTIVDARGARLRGDGHFRRMTTLAELPDKIDTEHRWIATAGYVLTQGQASAAFAGAQVSLPLERVFTFGVGCLDCELEYDPALAGEPCSSPAWSKGDDPRAPEEVEAEVDSRTVEEYVGDKLEEGFHRSAFGGEGGDFRGVATDDPRIVYGARCFWWDSIDRTSTTPSRDGRPGLPCCPYCGSVLMEAPDEAAWWRGNVEAVAAGRAPTYWLELLRWSRGRCFPSREAAIEAYLAVTVVEPERDG